MNNVFCFSVLFQMISKRESMQENNDDNELIKDEQVRKDIQVLSARLYDLRERFMKIVHKINKDSNDFADQISEEDDTTDDESDDEMSVDEEDNDSPKTSSEEGGEKQTQKYLIKSILENKARRYKYLKYVLQYPKIMKYLRNDNPNDIHIPLRYLEPFIKEYVDKNPTGKIYDKISQQIQDIRHSYLNNCQ